MAPSTNRHRSSPFQGGNGSSSLLGATVVVAEMAMQRIVVPRVETLNASSNLVGHPKHAYNIIFRSKRQMCSLLGNRKSLWVHESSRPKRIGRASLEHGAMAVLWGAEGFDTPN